jgi:DNA-binding response OmpR family regulator
MRVLLVEDELNVATFLKEGLEEQSFVVDHAKTRVDGTHLALGQKYDVVIVDRMLPDGDGLLLVREARAKGVATPILVLSAVNDPESRARLLDAGADDYVTKPFHYVELVARLRALIRRGRVSLPAVLKVGDLEFDPATRRVLASGHKVELSQREFTLLHLFMRYAGATLSRTMIGEQVWDYNFDSTSNVVDVYVGRLRKKLVDAGSKAKIETVRGAGYVLEAPADS